MANGPKRFDETTTSTSSLLKDSTEYIGIAQSSTSKKILTSDLMTAANVGLGNVDNTADSAKPVSDATQTALNEKANQSTTYTKTEVNDIADEKVNTSDIIDSLDNTSTDKPLSANQGRLLNELISTKVNNSLLGAANGVATLDGGGKVPSSQLPSYVDDVVEYDVVGDFPSEGEGSKIYVALDTGKKYRWSGTQYTEISSSLSIGETSGTAYDGAKGKANADAIKLKADKTDVADALDLKANQTDLETTNTNVQANATKISTNATNITKKVNTTDIVDSLEDTSIDKPLSAKQGNKLSTEKADQTDLNTTNKNVAANTTEITILQNKLLGTEYGIMIDETTGEVTRTGSAVGMSFGTPDGVNPITTDFDDVSIWKGMHAVKVSLDGIVKEPTEDGYDTFDGSSMISIPQGYYIKDERVDGYRYISICDRQIDSNYYPIKVRYLDTMIASDDGNGNLVCKPDLPPRKNISYDTGNSIIKAQGDGNWAMRDMTGSYLRWALSCIEAGSTDHKTAYGLGIQSGMPYGSSGYDVKVASTGNTVVVDSDKPFYVGMMVQVGTSYTNNSVASDRYITAITDNGDDTQTLTLDGDSFTVAIGNTCVTWGQPIPQAQFDTMQNGSGYILQFGSTARSHVFYRGMELQGNMWCLVDGFRRYDGEYYGCTDPQYYGASDVRTSEGWTDLGYNILADNGYQKLRECIKLGDGFVDVPLEWGSVATSNTFYSAYIYNFTSAYMGDRVLLLGGGWSNGSDVSPVGSNGGHSPSNAYLTVGCGLIRY